uniref:Uncharacterized protein n=1 Tax=Mustela putorius furo TaxID=9669 RepID=M3YUK4_MUSPF
GNVRCFARTQVEVTTRIFSCWKGWHSRPAVPCTAPGSAVPRVCRSPPAGSARRCLPGWKASLPPPLGATVPAGASDLPRRSLPSRGSPAFRASTGDPELSPPAARESAAPPPGDPASPRASPHLPEPLPAIFSFQFHVNNLHCENATVTPKLTLQGSSDDAFTKDQGGRC